jgi:hypothetical protein
MRRVLALLGAAAMIGAAILMRGVIEDDSDEEDEVVTVVCVAELLDVCDAWAETAGVAVVGQDVASTIEDLSDGRAQEGIDAWLAPAVWVEVARATQGADRSALGVSSRAIARARAALVVDADQDAAVDAACPTEPDWTCVAEIDRPPVALTDPESATGLPVLGAAAVGYFGTSDFASNDFDPAFEDWLAGFAEGTALAGDEPVDELVTAIGSLTAVGAIEPDAQAATRREDRAEVIYPPPVSYADIVLVPIAGRMSEGSRDDVASDEELRRSFDAVGGWQTDAIEGDDNQPDGGVLVALLERWGEVK